MAAPTTQVCAGNRSRERCRVYFIKDKQPVCGVGAQRAQLVSSLDAIAEACHVLRSAIADVRNIIHQADGLMDLPEAVPALD
jgi:hypothetical protein